MFKQCVVSSKMGLFSQEMSRKVRTNFFLVANQTSMTFLITLAAFNEFVKAIVVSRSCVQTDAEQKR